MHKTLVIYDEKYSGWILAGIAKDIYNYIDGPKKLVLFSGIHYRSYLKLFIFFLFANKIIFVNQSTLRRTRIPAFVLKTKNVLVFYSHTNYSMDNFTIKQLKCSNKIIVMNSGEQSKLGGLGINSSKIVLKPVGIDFDKFMPYNKNELNTIIMVSQLHSRKNPELILKVVRYLPNYRFILIGKNWDGSDYLHNLKQLKNFEYIKFDFETYVYNLNRGTIFLSLSLLEGGPIPILESMACGLVPVTTATGWAPDLIQDGINGILLPINCGPESVKVALEKALKIDKSKVRKSIESLTLDSFLSEF
jgi:glycosyltransferase involved in cell wall biosynthesis